MELSPEDAALFGDPFADEPATTSGPAPLPPGPALDYVEAVGRGDEAAKEAAIEKLEAAAVLPPDAPKNDASLTKEEKPRRGRKPKAESAPVEIKIGMGSATPTLAEYAAAAMQSAMAPAPNPLRDEFAKAALTGILDSSDWCSAPADKVAERAYAIADAMLKTRSA
jgi:hypothetical protein